MTVLEHGNKWWEGDVSCQGCNAKMHIDSHDLMISTENQGFVISCADCNDPVMVQIDNMPQWMRDALDFAIKEAASAAQFAAQQK